MSSLKSSRKFPKIHFSRTVPKWPKIFNLTPNDTKFKIWPQYCQDWPMNHRLWYTLFSKASKIPCLSLGSTVCRWSFLVSIKWDAKGWILQNFLIIRVLISKLSPMKMISMKDLLKNRHMPDSSGTWVRS